MATGFDPEAEQEVDFARYVRMLLRRWYLVAAGAVVGAIIGFLVSLGGAKVYTATATIYLGQPYNAAGTAPLLTLQTNPSAVSQIVNSQAVDAQVAAKCHTSAESFRKGISVQRVASASTATKGLASQINPLVTLTVQAPKGHVAACAANALAKAAVAGIGTYPEQKITNYEARIAQDTDAIQTFNKEIANPSVSETAKAYLLGRLQAIQTDLNSYSGFLLQAKDVELPSVTVAARPRQVTAQSSHNTVVIAAIIGLILGVIAALLWDRVLPARHAS